jgi:Fe-S cluster assembly protein SufD
MNKVTEYTITTAREDVITIDKPGEYHVFLTKAGAEVSLRGAFDVAGKDECNVTVIIHHKAPHTRANTMLRGVGRDQSRIRFEGRIIIDHDCGDSNSFLTERVLLLSDEAKAETIPDLEILTDDVKCSHAASISQIPQEHLFYLMSRGIPKQEAADMIVEGFLNLDD